MDDNEFKKVLFQKIDKITDDLTDIKVVQAGQKATLDGQATVLATHIRRTELNEENISILREQIKPIERSFHNMKAFSRLFLSLIAPLAAIITLAAKILHFF